MSYEVTHHVENTCIAYVMKLHAFSRLLIQQPADRKTNLDWTGPAWPDFNETSIMILLTYGQRHQHGKMFLAAKSTGSKSKKPFPISTNSGCLHCGRVIFLLSWYISSSNSNFDSISLIWSKDASIFLLHSTYSPGVKSCKKNAKNINSNKFLKCQKSVIPRSIRCNIRQCVRNRGQRSLSLLMGDAEDDHCLMATIWDHGISHIQKF